ncbi:hypothetical protein IJ425_06625 [bacterium]|nr:hypothetical protein [bacterium]
MFTAQSAIFLNDAKAEELTNQITDNSMDLRLCQKYSSNDIQAIHDKYAPEKERIRNEIEGLDKAENKEEYADLIEELKTLRDEEDAEVEAIENEMSEKEENINVENDLLETQLEDVNANTEVFQKMLDESIEDNFGYFN